MRATGIVRRIDDLGRIVVPKEIRRTLRIKESDPMEIYTGNGGEIMLRKYSPIGELAELAADYAKSLNRITGEAVLITDRECVVATAGIGANRIEKKEISQELVTFMENRKTAYFDEIRRMQIMQQESETIGLQEMAVATVICKGDVVGSVILIMKDESPIQKDTAILLVKIAADYLGNQIS